MKQIYMTEYKVRGIKNLDQEVSLSFYKKTITKPIDTQEYNIKGIYGMNGSGKSGIVASVDILRNILTNEDYLANLVVQKNLDAIINKRTKELSMETEFLVDMGDDSILYRYLVVLVKGASGKYTIGEEKLSYKRAVSRKETFDCLIATKDGDIDYIGVEKEAGYIDFYITKTRNLLSASSVASLFVEKILYPQTLEITWTDSFLFFSLFSLFMLGSKLYVYMDQSDDHTRYFLNDMIDFSDTDIDDPSINSLLKHVIELDRDRSDMLSIENNIIRKDRYEDYVIVVGQLKEFLHIFKSDLVDIVIDRKEDKDVYICNLIMEYESYSIDTEFESTGIKKLIKLFAYIKEMVQGGIVFIDEMDSNLHDVYLCALLEYLMEFGEGQLCFTTHNVGPMDVLKKHKKSIDFLSVDHKTYSWTTNGNYSPSRLYRNGMIEGSPFNVSYIDFIGIFDLLGKDDVE